jgi:hypothetical protein
MFRRTAVLIGLIAAFCVGPAAWASTYGYGIGSGSDFALSTRHPLTLTPAGAGWLVRPQTVSADPEAGAWLKHLQSPGRLLGRMDTFYLLEVIRVGSEPAWTDWHEEILTPGWSWGSGAMYAYRANLASLNLNKALAGNGMGAFPFNWFGSIEPIAQGEIKGDRIDFSFEALDPSSWVFILKSIHWTGEDGGRRFAPIRIAEYPSPVPIPSALVLLGGGLIGLVAIRKTRSSR